MSARDEAHGLYWQLVAEGGWLAGQCFPIRQRVVLGRAPDCDIIIPGTYLSRHHVELLPAGEHLLIRDLGSSNGTFLNGQRVTESKAGDAQLLQIDVLRFRIQAPLRARHVAAAPEPGPPPQELPLSRRQAVTPHREAPPPNAAPGAGVWLVMASAGLLFACLLAVYLLL